MDQNGAQMATRWPKGPAVSYFGSILLNFGSIFGPKWCQSAPKWPKMAQNGAQMATRGPKGPFVSSFGPIWLHFGGILGPILAYFWLFFDQFFGLIFD